MNSSSKELGPIGTWTAQFDSRPVAIVREAAGELDQLGFRAIWYRESLGRESLTNAALLLSATSQIVVASGNSRMRRTALMIKTAQPKIPRGTNPL